VSEARPLVVKIGGGLLRDHGLDGLRTACAEATAIAERRPVLVVPGGGPFADVVRAVDERVGLADDVAHTLALRAMDQLGVLLRRLLPSARVQSELAAGQGLALLLATPAFDGRSGVPESWDVTSDSLAVLAGGAIAAEVSVLLKPVAGVLPRWPSEDPPLAELTAAELRQLQARGGGRAVDAYLPEAVTLTGVPAVVRRPGADDPGTLITPG
jgi:5-(aminomethyl)-3-furanmethanol phosphate kinase